MAELDHDMHDESGIAAALLVAMLDDDARGDLRPVEDYVERFRGFEAVVRQEYAAFVDSDAPPSDPGVPPIASGRYRLEGEIGRGGMGIVYRAYEERLDRVLALKAARGGGTSPAFSRLVSEARITARLDHPGIVPVHELGLEGVESAWFTMPLVRGRTFAEVIASLHGDGAPTYLSEPWRNALDALVRVCEAVAFAHSRGVFHRDLKPQNVMVGPFGEVYVMDWGLAHARQDARSDDAGQAVASDAGPAGGGLGLTREGDVLGTPGYMPPEQLSGTVDACVDVYAIGAMLYHLLAGHMPYGGPEGSSTTGEVLDALREGPPPPLAEVAPHAPAELVAVCERAMARDPAARYPSVEALRRDLRAHLDGRVVAAHERGPWAELRKWIARNRAISGALLTAVLALVVGLVVSLVQTARADRAAALANASFVDSVRAVQQMLTRVGDSELEFVPQTAVLRRDLLLDATAFLERFLTDRPDDVPLLLEASAAWYRVAAIRSQIGEHEGAAAASRRALELADRGLQLEPGDRALRLARAKALFQAGNDRSTQGDHDAGIPLLRRAVDETEPLLEDWPIEEVLAGAGSTRDALALALLRTGRLDDAEEHAHRSIDLRRELVERFGDTHLGDLGTPLALRAGIHSERGDHAAALEALRGAEDARRRFLALDPDAPRARAQLAEVLRNLSGLVFVAGSFAEPAAREAEALAAEAVSLRRRNVEIADDTAGPRLGLADALLQQARLRRRLEDPIAARELAREALEAVERGIAIDPAHQGIRSSMPLVHRELHRCALVLGDPDGVLENAARLAARDPSEPRWRFEAACLFAEAGEFIEGPAGTEGTERAMALLRDLAAEGGIPAAALRDPRLDRLRARADFPEPRR